MWDVVYPEFARAVKGTRKSWLREGLKIFLSRSGSRKKVWFAEAGLKVKIISSRSGSRKKVWFAEAGLKAKIISSRSGFTKKSFVEGRWPQS